MIQVEVVFSPGPGQTRRLRLELPAGATLAQALGDQRVAQQLGGACGFVDAGVWGRRCPPGQTLRDGDRLEIYRPLRCDPKQARRERHRARTQSRPTPKPEGQASGA